MLPIALQLSELLREIPATATLRVVYCASKQGLLDYLMVQRHDGTTYGVPTPAGSRRVLSILFPTLLDWSTTHLDKGCREWVLRVTPPQNPARAHAESRVLCARIQGVL